MDSDHVNDLKLATFYLIWSAINAFQITLLNISLLTRLDFYIILKLKFLTYYWISKMCCELHYTNQNTMQSIEQDHLIISIKVLPVLTNWTIYILSKETVSLKS